MLSFGMKRKTILAGPQGFEPRYAAPEAAVLPLNEGPVPKIAWQRHRNNGAE
jgi:hypothetical protein